MDKVPTTLSRNIIKGNAVKGNKLTEKQKQFLHRQATNTLIGKKKPI